MIKKKGILKKRIEQSKFIVNFTMSCEPTNQPPPPPHPKKGELHIHMKTTISNTLTFCHQGFYMYTCMFIAKNFNVLKNIVSLILAVLKCWNQ